MKIFEFTAGESPLLISIPHCGIQLPQGFEQRLTPVAKQLTDTDWHVERLFDFALKQGCSIIEPLYSRYLIDLNRAADGQSLYPGQNVTELCPTTTFAEEDVYLPGEAPDEKEIAQRIEHYWRPYHLQVQQELQRLREKFGVAILLEAHSIRSQVPRFFEGELPSLNLGTVGGESCDGNLREQLQQLLSQSDYTHVIDGRFKGGYLTRVNGNPMKGIHSLQLEIAQNTYMQQVHPFNYNEHKAVMLQQLLSRIVTSILNWSQQHAR